MSDALDLITAWDRVLTTLGRSDLAPHRMALLGLTRPVGLVDNTVLIAAPNEFTQNFLESRLRPRLTEQLSKELDREVRIAVTVEGPVPDTASRGLDRDIDSGDPDRAPDHTQHGGATENGAPVSEDHPTHTADQDDQDDRDSRDSLDSLDSDADNDRPHDDRPHDNAAVPGNVSSLTDHPRRSEVRDGDHRDGGEHPSSDDGTEQTRSGSNGGRLTSLPRARSRTHPPARLNPKYTFDSFVIGNSNRFAHAAAFAVAEVRAYNPMFIYGESGLGKTHLLHAIGHYSETFFPHHRVNYFTTEEFTNDFINQVHAGRAEDFRRRYRDVDLLLVDDVQFLERAERTQEEFFHTFNTLHSAGKQIVISSDRPPKQLTTLEDRLRTRFEWGLITDVQAPDLETRIAILRKKVAGDVLPEVDPEVLEYIASKIQTNIRELEGALIRVNAYASLNRTGVSIGLAEEVLRDLLPDTEGPTITATIIMSVTAEYFGVSVDDLKGHSRSRVLVTARQIAMFLCRELTELSLPRIGQIFGGKDHTTVMHAVRKISALMAERRAIFNQVTELTGRIKARARQ